MPEKPIKTESVPQWWDKPWELWFEISVAGVIVVGASGLFLPFFTERFAWLRSFFFDVVEVYIAPAFVAMDSVLIAGIIYALVKGWAFRPALSLFDRVSPKKKGEFIKDEGIARAWKILQDRAVTGIPDTMRLALIEADALIDTVLKKAGYEGEHMADRLSELTSDEVVSLDRVWRAHRLRNDLVHTPGFTVTPNDTSFAMKAYEDFLRELGVL